MSNQLEQLRDLSVVVADTGEIEKIKQYKPVDATTNPSLLLKVSNIDEYKSFVTDAVDFGIKNGKNDDEVISLAMDRLFVTVGQEISKIVPGVVSTEVDARLSFDTQATIEKARSLIAMYKELGVDKDKVLIKIASTWEGIKAAEVLEKEGIHCNMTLLFNLVQAVACAEVNATLISPFVGRITDWYKASEGVDGYDAKDDPGVKSVTTIYNYFKKFGYKTVVMAASFRNKGQVLRLAGCDKLTLSPDRLAELESSTDKVEKFLDADAKHDDIERIDADEKAFRWSLNEDAMATEKLSEGIRKFAADARKLENTMREIIKSKQ